MHALTSFKSNAFKDNSLRENSLREKGSMDNKLTKEDSSVYINIYERDETGKSHVSLANLANLRKKKYTSHTYTSLKNDHVAQMREMNQRKMVNFL